MLKATIFYLIIKVSKTLLIIFFYLNDFNPLLSNDNFEFLSKF